jgi:phosphoribosyl-AMP cyclohydrolase
MRTDEEQKLVEEGNVLMLDFKKLVVCGVGVVPCIVKHYNTREVLIPGFANQTALEQTIQTGIATLWSTSRNELWVKGTTSGSFLQVEEIRVNCEQNALLYLVIPANGACHTKDKRGKYRSSCFYRKIEGGQLVFVDNEKEGGI